MYTWALGTFDSMTNRRLTPPHPVAVRAASRTAHRHAIRVVIPVPLPIPAASVLQLTGRPHPARARPVQPLPTTAARGVEPCRSGEPRPPPRRPAVTGWGTTPRGPARRGLS